MDRARVGFVPGSCPIFGCTMTTSFFRGEGMRNFVLFILAAAIACAQPIVLKTSVLLDGKGNTLQKSIIVVEGSKITRVGGPVPAGAVVYDLTAFTVTPGWIDTHSHIAYHFDNK